MSPSRWRRARGFGPAFDRDLAASRVDADGDPAGETPAGRFFTRAGSRTRDCAQDDAAQALAQPALDLVKRADTAAELHRDFRSRLRMASTAAPLAALSRESAVEIDDVQLLEALALEDLACAAGSVLNTVAWSMSPSFRRTACPPLEVDGGERGSFFTAFDNDETTGHLGPSRSRRPPIRLTASTSKNWR